MIGYSFAGQLPNPTQSGEVETLSTTFGADLDLGRSWRLSGYVAYGREECCSRPKGLYNRPTCARRSARSRTTRSRATTPRGTGSSTRSAPGRPTRPPPWPSSAAAGIGSGARAASRRRTSCSMANSSSFRAVRSSSRWRSLQTRNLRSQGRHLHLRNGSDPGRALTKRARRGGRLCGSAHPPVRLRDARPGLRRLELSLAARFEDYADVGQTTSPKVGVVWEPIEGALLRANYGRSFRAPALREINDAATASPSILPRGSQQILSMILYGGNPDLEPETADTLRSGEISAGRR